MVSQNVRSKNSSARRKRNRGYVFPCDIETDWQLPEGLELGPFVGPHNYSFNVLSPHKGTDGYSIFGKIEGSRVNPASWKESPHRAFVNLPSRATSTSEMEMIDPKAMLWFTRRYGFLCGVSKSSNRPPSYDPTLRIEYLACLKEANDCLMPVEGCMNLQSIVRLASKYGLKLLLEDRTVPWSQALLKFVWQSNDRQILADFANHASRDLTSHCDYETGEIITTIKSVWSLICLLIVRDRAAGKTAVCANPECPAPYFLKSRKTQKICEAGDCVAWAQRNYALKWWRENESKASKGATK